MPISSPPIAEQTLTYAEYLTEGTIKRRYDILNGVRVYMANPTILHQDILMNVATALKRFGRESGLGRMVPAACDVLITMSPLHTRQPDVLFISYQRFGNRSLDDPTPLSPAPELVVEILSPSDTRRVLAGKLADYQSVGVKECWVVSPGSQTVEVLRLAPNSMDSAAIYGLTETVSSEALPNLTVLVAEIFA